ncbi:hypothetical protein BG015_006333 [Linnemannia schmuckeri]|uniref:NADH:flavin oxidoreductase/NADH oxidase N-terminal domain-containing protein n=1 Tax=Linnemannia schmuckeri TaxID=64567 RepID=A0A9P5S6G1_9FUNG|nr:hypothetical protein BG015_006333 [Linnemannia schmuckeri]
MVTPAIQNQFAAAETIKNQDTPVKTSSSSSSSLPQESFRIHSLVAPGSGTPAATALTLPLLFQPFIANRIVVAAMSMYSSKDGFMTDFQLEHLGSYALHGARLIFAEASAVEARGRITPGCAGIYSDNHVPGVKRVVDFVHSTGGKIGVRLFHAGRKIQDIVKAFGAAAVRADEAGMDTVEIQGAYGYLIHTFLSPITNHRTDRYGGSLENRSRLLLEVVREVRANFSAEKPIFLRLSVSDCVEHLSNISSIVIEEAVQVAQWAKDAGLDVIHGAAGENTPLEVIPRFPGYMVHYAARIRQDVPGFAVVAVGAINSAKQAQEIVEARKADLVAAASAFLKRPTFALDAGRELGVDVAYAPQYGFARRT